MVTFEEFNRVMGEVFGNDLVDYWPGCRERVYEQYRREKGLKPETPLWGEWLDENGEVRGG